MGECGYGAGTTYGRGYDCPTNCYSGGDGDGAPLGNDSSASGFGSGLGWSDRDDGYAGGSGDGYGSGDGAGNHDYTGDELAGYIGYGHDFRNDTGFRR